MFAYINPVLNSQSILYTPYTERTVERTLLNVFEQYIYQAYFIIGLKKYVIYVNSILSYLSYLAIDLILYMIL